MSITSLSGRVYVDTSVLVAALFSDAAHYQLARDFCESLFNTNSVVCFSDLLRVEVLHALRRIGATPGFLTGSVRRRHRLQHWGQIEAVRETWLRNGIREFEALLEEFYRVDEIALTPSIIDASATLMARYNLKSNDAVHVATARAAGVTQIVTLDRDFASVTQPSVLLLQS